MGIISCCEASGADVLSEYRALDFTIGIVQAVASPNRVAFTVIPTEDTDIAGGFCVGFLVGEIFGFELMTQIGCGYETLDRMVRWRIDWSVLSIDIKTGRSMMR